jgi:hypothetical protein
MEKPKNWDYIKKNLFKVKGVVVAIIKGYNGWNVVIVQKGKQKYPLTFHDDIYLELKQISPSKEVNFYFTIKCKEYNNKWYTDLILCYYNSYFLDKLKEKTETELPMPFGNKDFLSE